VSELSTRQDVNGDINKVFPEDVPVHRWYRFVLSFPPHLVREYIARFELNKQHRVLDPFCGTGTTLVECKKLGIASVGLEANPVAQFASRVKVDWSVPSQKLVQHAEKVAEATYKDLEETGIYDTMDCSGFVNGRALRTLEPCLESLLLTGSISPLPLHKTLVLLHHLEKHHDARLYEHERLAVAKALVYGIGNLRFGPEVSVGLQKSDVPVVATWLTNIYAMAQDLNKVWANATVPAEVYLADARYPEEVLEPSSIDAVITSPPYPNEKDYTRTTRLEAVLLGFVRDKADLRAMKQGLVRSNTRNVYKDDDDDRWVAGHPEVERISKEIEERRMALKKTSGFERLYSKVAKLYFGGMARHLAGLRPYLRPGARLAYVVGDQASYLRVMIRTGEILGDIAQRLGYELEEIALFRTRMATATREQLREEVVVLRWPGRSL